MARQSIHFEWYFADEGGRWPFATQPIVHEEARPDAERWLAGWLLRLVALTFTGLALAAATSPTPSEQATIAAKEAVRTVLQREESAWKQNDQELYSTLFDHQIRREWRREWRVSWSIPPEERTDLGMTLVGMELLGDLMVVDLLITQPPIEWWRPVPYFERRYYRQVEQGWVRTVPGATFWGRQYEVETPHLRFVFTERDAPLVMSIADQMETAYLAIYALLQLPPPSTDNKFTLAIVPELANTWRTNRNSQRIMSPHLAPIAQGLSRKEHLADEVFDRMAGYVLNEIQLGIGRSDSSRWRTVFWALRGHLCREILVRCSPWYEQATTRFAQQWQANAGQPLRLTDIRDRYSNELGTREMYLWEYGATHTLIDYVITTYGWDHAPDLIYGLSRFSFWSGVIPNVYKQTILDFERAWNQHVQARW
jgi:hypothetical protein